MPNDLHTMTSTHVVGVFASSEGRTSLENPNLNLNDPKVWDEVFGGSSSTDAGITITKQRALECPPFWQAVQLIAGDCGMIPLAPERRQVKFERTYWEEDTNHWTYSLVAVQANDDETSQDYWERIMCDALVWGDGWGIIAWDMGGRASEMFHLLPDRTQWENVGGRRICVSEIGGRLQTFDPMDILHISGLKPLGGTIPDFVNQARNTIAAFLSANQFTSKFFKHGGRAGGILELPTAMPKPVQQQIEEGFRKTYEGGEDSFKTVILRDNAKFHAAQTSPREVQAVESSERLARDVARWFGLPASMLNVEGTSSYNSKSQDSSGYVTHCLMRWLKKIQGQCRLRLLPPRERASIRYCHDTDELFTMDLQSRMTAYQIGVASKVLNPNDARIEEGLSPYEEGEKYENPNTSAPAQAVEPDDEEPEDDPAEEMDDSPEPAQRKRLPVDDLRAVISCGLAARHKAKKPNAFVDFVAKMDRSSEWQVAIGAAFDQVVETCTHDDLVATVERVCGQFEQIYLGD